MKFFKITICLFIAVFLMACSTQKNTAVSRGYHNLTAHYNVYFNGNESYKKGVQKVRQENKDDFSEILPMYEYSNAENISGIASDMDRAMQKGVKLITKHSITKKPKKNGSDGTEQYQAFYNQKEFNKWVDEAYILIGKSQFYKHDFAPAHLAFDHVIRDFPTNKSAYEARIWKAAAYAEKGDYANAKEALDSYESTGAAPYSLHGKYMAVYADLLLKQEKYEEAIPFLMPAAAKASDKYSRMRFQFILAQVLEAAGRKKEAIEAYNKVLKMRPPYEMSFNAQIGKAAIVLEGSSTEVIKREINKILKNKKNVDYRDRIYYALANVNMQDGEMDEAIENLKLSTSSSVGNEKQKVRSFIKLGDIYFSQPNYVLAFQAYDSAMVYMPKTNDQYDEISQKHQSLLLLVDNINVVERQDSLQNLAKMSETQRLVVLTKMVDDENKRLEEAKRLQEEQEYNGMNNVGAPQFSGASNNQGKWYFYNPSALNIGKSEFQRVWGRRKNEDHWRRSNKSVQIEEASGDPGEPGGDGQSVDANNPSQDKNGKEAEKKESQMSVKSLMVDIPLTDSAMQVSHQEIKTALLDLGIIYRDRFSDFPRATETFEELLRRYPTGDQREDAYIEMYQVYYYSENTQGMETTKQRSVKEFPDSRFTAYLTDPEFFNKMDQQRKAQSGIYEQTYVNYLNGLFPEVINVSDNQIKNSDSDDVLLPKYRLLKSLAYAHLADGEQFKTNLEELVEKHPETEQAELAKQFLKELEAGRNPVRSTTAQSILFSKPSDYVVSIPTAGEVSGLKYQPDAPHSLIVIADQGADMKRLVFNFADFNFGRFLLNDYDLKTQQLPDRTNVLEVKGFNNKREALDYFYAARQTPSLFAVKNAGKPKLFAVSDDNIKQLISSGDILGNVSFFIKNYLLVPDDKLVNKNDSIHIAMSYVQPVVENLADKKLAQEQASLPANQVKSYDVNQAPFYFVVVYDASRVNHERLKTNYIGFNRNNGYTKLSTVELVELSPTRRLLVVKSFETEKEASNYLNLIKGNPFTMRDILTKNPQVFIIGEENYNLLINDKSEENYLKYINQQ